MIEIEELIKNLPVGKKIQYLGRSYYQAIKNYFEKYLDSSEIELDDIVSKYFYDLIQEKNFIKDLMLFDYEKLSEIISVENLEKFSLNDIKKELIKYYSFSENKKDVVNSVQFNESLITSPLHDFQERIRRKVVNLIFNNHKRFLIHMPTGSGKTRTAAEILIDFIRFSSSRALLNNKLKILWIAQSSELCIQAYQTVEWLLNQKGTKNIAFGHFYGDYELSEGIEKNEAIIFCSIQKLLLHYKEDIWRKIKNDNYLVIVDEAHRSIASQWINALDYFVSDSSVYLIGLTATPGLGNELNEENYTLSSYYSGNKISITDDKYTTITSPIQYLVNRGFLSEIERIDIDSSIKISGSIKMENNEFKFSNKTFKELSLNPDRNSSIINIIQENSIKNKKILVFTCGLEHNRIIQTILSELNIESETVDQGSKNRESIISRFKDGDLNILLNFGVLTTGFDAPKTDVCIIARPITSIVMYSQMVGRILRGPKNNGNKKNKLYTIKDNLNHGDYDNLFNSFNEFYY